MSGETTNDENVAPTMSGSSTNSNNKRKRDDEKENNNEDETTTITSGGGGGNQQGGFVTPTGSVNTGTATGEQHQQDESATTTGDGVIVSSHKNTKKNTTTTNHKKQKMLIRIRQAMGDYETVLLVNRTHKFQKVFEKYAENNHQQVSSMRFKFDGYYVDPKSTPLQLLEQYAPDLQTTDDPDDETNIVQIDCFIENEGG